MEFVDNVKMEKANAMKKYDQLQKIGNFFRIFEICVVLVLVSWFSTRLPNVIQVLGYYFQEFCIILVSPRFVFFLGNAIILTLFIKSGKISRNDDSSVNSGGDHIYDEFIKKSNETNQKIQKNIHFSPKEEIVYEDKQTVYEEKNNYTVPSSDTTAHVSSSTTAMNTKMTKKMNKTKDTKFRRTQSGIPKGVSTNENPINKSELRRSVTEKCRRPNPPVVVEESVEVDYEQEMSNEEFQRTIEEFIAKQRLFRREESMAIVLQ
ncbi:hypothetical protein C5167_037578 [Papaver somniferum]|uniref:DUF4408 domain-containing protein n=1 Tax=Papaver somniferum TaxID=3469 RepID=A0A4Y7IB36_PAPSO|nr:uncharacterized protein LOC113288503 [Papaver somniferum]RZC44635.1 hypothetical protein C5167_037578 [Papaver somniferum]